MSKKTKSIRLTGGWGGYADQQFRYRVEQVTDSVEFAPGDMLEKPKVESLCDDKNWCVTIVAHRP